MRRVLILGGTGWLGARIARIAVADGAEVVCLARGRSGAVPGGAGLIAVDRTTPDAYADTDGEWDEVIELAYAPELVEPALAALSARASHWTLVSTVSVYASNDDPGADESAATVEPSDASAYADAKVLAERASAERLGDRLLVARPGLIVGPGDPSDRFGYWPARLARGGRVVVPTTGGRHVQVIDVDDLAAWIVRAGREGLTGTVNAVGDAHSMADFFAATSDMTGFTGELVSLGDEELLAQQVHYWSGPRSLPLWLPADATGFAQRSNAAFRESGGTLRSLGDTLERTLADELERGIARPRGAGLTAEDEASILIAAGRP